MEMTSNMHPAIQTRRTWCNDESFADAKLDGPLSRHIRKNDGDLSCLGMAHRVQIYSKILET